LSTVRRWCSATVRPVLAVIQGSHIKAARNGPLTPPTGRASVA
jgi:hypothetical protein